MKDVPKNNYFSEHLLNKFSILQNWKIDHTSDLRFFENEKRLIFRLTPETIDTDSPKGGLA